MDLGFCGLFNFFLSNRRSRFLAWAFLIGGAIACSKPGGKNGPERDEVDDDDDALVFRNGPNLLEVCVGDSARDRLLGFFGAL